MSFETGCMKICKVVTMPDFRTVVTRNHALQNQLSSRTLRSTEAAYIKAITSFYQLSLE
jgi:hypothetical protein